jgi:hypothetical protein
MGRPQKRCWLTLAAFMRAAEAAFTCLPANNPADCGALGDLYTAAGGAAWAGVLPSDGWSLGAGGGMPDVCASGSFTGVTCDASGRVASMCVPRAAPVPSAALARAAACVARISRRGQHDLLGGADYISPLRSLIQKGLVGSLPASLGNLTGLTRLCVPPQRKP